VPSQCIPHALTAGWDASPRTDTEKRFDAREELTTYARQE